MDVLLALLQKNGLWDCIVLFLAFISLLASGELRWRRQEEGKEKTIAQLLKVEEVRAEREEAKDQLFEKALGTMNEQRETIRDLVDLVRTQQTTMMMLRGGGGPPG